jgi:hypothetical protein
MYDEIVKNNVYKSDFMSLSHDENQVMDVEKYYKLKRESVEKQLGL